MPSMSGYSGLVREDFLRYTLILIYLYSIWIVNYFQPMVRIYSCLYLLCAFNYNVPLNVVSGLVKTTVCFVYNHIVRCCPAVIDHFGSISCQRRLLDGCNDLHLWESISRCSVFHTHIHN